MRTGTLVLINAVVLAALLPTLLWAQEPILIDRGNGSGWGTGSAGCVHNLHAVLEGIAERNNPPLATDFSELRTQNILICEGAPMTIRAESLLQVLEIVVERYPTCFRLELDREQHKMKLSPGPDLIIVESVHVENSTYRVEGKPPFSLETNNQTRTRYFCPANLTGAAPWAQRAFGDREIRRR